MTDRPILFSAPMVRALLDGRKTQTRRVLNPQPGDDIDNAGDGETIIDMATGQEIRMRFAVGDRLWVKETFCEGFDYDEADKPIGDEPRPFYAATECPRWYDTDTDAWRDQPKWTPSIFMRRRASRLTLIVTEVRVERLQDISRDDAIAEGLTLASNVIEQFWRWPEPHHANLWLSPPAAYRHLWNAINGADAWEANPWIVAITFTVEHRNIDNG